MITACNCIHCVESGFDELSLNDDDRKNANTTNNTKHIPTEPQQSRRNKLAQKPEDDEDDYYDYDEERRMRKILNDRLYHLHSIVPNITKLDRTAILTDVITYTQELKQSVEELNNQLLEPSGVHENRIKIEEIDDEQRIKIEEIEDEQETKNLEITPEIELRRVSETKLWIKAVFPKKRGVLVKLMEAIGFLEFDLNETSITTSRGAVLFTTVAEGIHGGLGLEYTHHILTCDIFNHFLNTNN